MKEDLKIYFSEDSEIVELEIEQKEWRGDVVININEKFYMLEFITITRLTQEYLRAQEENRVYTIDNKTIIIVKPDKKTIINTIKKLSETNFFNKCNSVDLHDKYKTVFIELQNINNWIQVY